MEDRGCHRNKEMVSTEKRKEELVTSSKRGVTWTNAMTTVSILRRETRKRKKIEDEEN